MLCPAESGGVFGVGGVHMCSFASSCCGLTLATVNHTHATFQPWNSSLPSCISPTPLQQSLPHTLSLFSQHQQDHPDQDAKAPVQRQEAKGQDRQALSSREGGQGRAERGMHLVYRVSLGGGCLYVFLWGERRKGASYVCVHTHLCVLVCTHREGVVERDKHPSAAY